jgi:hypothetical protein
MAKFRTGLEIEDRLKTILERAGCAITEDADLDHAWKIDFVITRFPQIPSIFAMGIQVTSRPDDLAKLEEFLRIHQYNRIAEKVMYLEFDNYADLDKGGGFAAMAAMMDYRLNTHWRNTPIIGIRINNDLTISTFNLQERISELRRKQSQAHQQQAPRNRTLPPNQEQRREPQKNQESSAPVAAAHHPQPAHRTPQPEPVSQSAESADQRQPVAAARKQKPDDETVAVPATEKKPRRRRPRSAKPTER